MDDFNDRNSNHLGRDFTHETIRGISERSCGNGLTTEILRSFAAFSEAPLLERRCLFAVAARTQPVDLLDFHLIFNSIDTNKDGTIDRVELVTALESARQWCPLRLNADSIFRAIAQHRHGVISFMEFVAACLHSRLAPLDAWLAGETFESLDTDQDGLVQAVDVALFFGELPPGFTKSQIFLKDEWTSFVLELASRTNHGDTGHSGLLSTLVEMMLGICRVNVDGRAPEMQVAERDEGACGGCSETNVNEMVIDNPRVDSEHAPPIDFSNIMSDPPPQRPLWLGRVDGGSDGVDRWQGRHNHPQQHDEQVNRAARTNEHQLSSPFYMPISVS
eukprot:TRINITY_DN37268_c0_g1_i1.p1 TRINITY_DN37268_c0_g1~~TRINITY_DN37268_c0_g1_i1.p1  ORF type:complete len:360 (+),score=53.14 TRINITY_DN37268_c0_g1_i1:82-1080(+)